MEYISDILNEVLKTESSFFDESGKMLKNKVYESVLKMDERLLELLLQNEETKKRFFIEVSGVLVFDKVKFGWLINNRQFLPNSFTRYRNKIGLVSGENYISQNNNIELVFPYKDCVLEGGQTKEGQKRSEIFYNESLAPNDVNRLLAPKVFTNVQRYTDKTSSSISDFSENDNLIIKGNNLLVISSLLKRYENRIDCIYIDPPYNTKTNANTFSYNNTFNRSTWLVFMKNRLEIAKRLLAKDGVLVVAIDKYEQARLQLLIEEIFEEANFEVDCITVVHNPRGAAATNFSYTHEYAIFVTPKGKKVIGNSKNSEVEWSRLRNWGGESLRTDAKNCFYPIIVKNEKIIGFGDVCDDNFHPQQTEEKDGKYFIYPIDTKGIERKWRYARQSVEEIIDTLRVIKTSSGKFDIEIGKDSSTQKTVWTDSKYDANKYGTQVLKKILPNSEFSYPKSLYTVIDCVKSVVENRKDALVLDFFGGSGTTAHAVMEINKEDGGNRKFILVEQMDYVQTETLQRNLEIMKTMPYDMAITYFELKKLNQKFVDEILELHSEDKLKDIWRKVLEKGFINNKIIPSEIDFEDGDFLELNIDEKKKLLLELLDKNHLYVNYSDIEDIDFSVSESDKLFNKSFYSEV